MSTFESNAVGETLLEILRKGSICNVGRGHQKFIAEIPSSVATWPSLEAFSETF